MSFCDFLNNAGAVPTDDCNLFQSWMTNLLTSINDLDKVRCIESITEPNTAEFNALWSPCAVPPCSLATWCNEDVPPQCTLYINLLGSEAGGDWEPIPSCCTGVYEEDDTDEFECDTNGHVTEAADLARIAAVIGTSAPATDYVLHWGINDTSTTPVVTSWNTYYWDAATGTWSCATSSNCAIVQYCYMNMNPTVQRRPVVGFFRPANANQSWTYMYQDAANTTLMQCTLTKQKQNSFFLVLSGGTQANVTAANALFDRDGDYTVKDDAGAFAGDINNGYSPMHTVGKTSGHGMDMVTGEAGHSFTTWGIWYDQAAAGTVFSPTFMGRTICDPGGGDYLAGARSGLNQMWLLAMEVSVCADADQTT
jgi:hypothetical protein